MKMKTNRQELTEDMLAGINGGVDFLPDGSNFWGSGTLGFNSSPSVKPYKYKSFAAVDAYINLHDVDKVWENQDEFDAYMIAGMLEAGIITKIQ